MKKTKISVVLFMMDGYRIVTTFPIIEKLNYDEHTYMMKRLNSGEKFIWIPSYRDEFFPSEEEMEMIYINTNHISRIKISNVL